MKRVWMVIAGGALLVALTLTAVQMPAFAQQSEGSPEAGDTSADEDGGFLDALATALGISREELDGAIDDAQLAMIDQWAAEARDLVEAGESVFPGFGDGFGPIGPRGGDFESGRIVSIAQADGQAILINPDGPGAGALSDNINELAAFLGVSGEELREQLADGENIIEIAAAQGVSESELRDWMIGQATQRIDDFLSQLGTDAGNTEGESDSASVS